MESHRFDKLAKAFSTSASRRRTIAGLAGGALAALLGGLGPEEAGAACVALNRTCGSGRRCCAGTACRSGKCRCKAGLTACAGRCVDTDTNQDHCGGCGRACDPGEDCADGTCVVPPPVACPGGPGRCPVTESKNELVEPGKRMVTTATLNCDGLLTVEAFTDNTDCCSALRGRIRVVAFDTSGKSWTSPLFACTTRCGTLDITCSIPRSGTDRFTAQVPADFARCAERLEIFHANNRDPLP